MHCYRKTRWIERLLLGVGSVLVAWLVAFGQAKLSPSSAQTELNSAAEIHAYERLGELEGWIWMGEALYLTRTGGQFWREITPPLQQGQRLSAVSFQNMERGWVVLREEDGRGENRAWVGYTTDSGQNWTIHPLPLVHEDVSLPVAEDYLTVGDHNTLWLVRRFVTSANFSVGVLYRSLDGAKSWQRFDLPIAEPIRIEGGSDLWLSGGPRGDEVYFSPDGGATWQPMMGDLITLPELSGKGGLPNGKSALVDWKLEQQGNCEAGAVTYSPSGGYHQELRCQTVQTLWATSNAGRDWKRVSLPNGKDSITSQRLVNTAYLAPDPLLQPLEEQTQLGPLVAFMQGQSFDKCEIPTLQKLAVWRVHSPYRAVNLYIGGIHRACKNTLLTPEFIAQLRQQGWGLIPTWVGLQASCTSYKHRMSADPFVSYQQGRSEAEAATAAAQQLGLTNASGSGSVIYYDLEYYDIKKEACNQAARAFINGWVERMNELGMIGGVYSTGGPLSQFADLPNPPPVIWAAHWIHETYNPEATVWDVYCLSNDLWKDHQRLRQYTGGHYESWGEVRLSIDSNVMDGIVSFHLYLPAGFDHRNYFPLIFK